MKNKPYPQRDEEEVDNILLQRRQAAYADNSLRQKCADINLPIPHSTDGGGFTVDHDSIKKLANELTLALVEAEDRGIDVWEVEMNIHHIPNYPDKPNPFIRLHVIGSNPNEKSI